MNTDNKARVTNYCVACDKNVTGGIHTCEQAPRDFWIYECDDEIVDGPYSELPEDGSIWTPENRIGYTHVIEHSAYDQVVATNASLSDQLTWALKEAEKRDKAYFEAVDRLTVEWQREHTAKVDAKYGHDQVVAERDMLLKHLPDPVEIVRLQSERDEYKEKYQASNRRNVSFECADLKEQIYTCDQLLKTAELKSAAALAQAKGLREALDHARFDMDLSYEKEIPMFVKAIVRVADAIAAFDAWLKGAGNGK